MMLYQRFKIWVWLILAIASGSGAISKSYHGESWEVLLNAGIALFSFIVFVSMLIKNRAITVSVLADNGNARLIIFFTIIGTLAAAAVIPYQMEAGLMDILTEREGVALGSAIMLTIFQSTLLTMISSYIGLSLSKRVNLGAPMLTKLLNERSISPISVKWLRIAIIGSVVGTLFVAVFEVYIFQPLLTIDTTLNVSVWKILLLMFYGGIVEEILLRLGLMTVVVWALSRPYRKKGKKIPDYVYWAAILGSAILFGLAHLPVTEMVLGSLSTIIFVRAIVLNGLLGMFFGFLYWKRGIEYSIIAHMLADLLLHVVWFQVFQYISA